MEELKREEQLAALNDAGRQHWELVCVLEFSRAYLKRPKEYASELPPARVISDEEHDALQLKRHRDETRFRY
jgi:hypothetical protein